MTPSYFARPLSVILFGLAALSTAGPLRSQVLTTTLCEIHRNPMKYNGKMVKTDGKTIPPGIDVTLPSVEERGEMRVAFKLEKTSWDSFTSFLDTTKRFEPVLVALVGQIRVKKGFHLREFGDGVAGNGYGTRGLYRLQIVVLSAEHFAEMKGTTP